MELIETSNVQPRMQTIADLLKQRTEVFRSVEEAQTRRDAPEMELHFGKWKELTREIEHLQKAGV
ncbi:MAG: hypothetical protein JWO13_2255 [Acidobacteriales bacterium]|nr:hypothetical protein [Terriglobales bacterium]